MSGRLVWGLIAGMALVGISTTGAHASAVGEFVEISGILRALISLAYLFGIAALVYGAVQGVIELFATREYGSQWMRAFMGVGVGAMLLFFVLPRLTGYGEALASTLR